VADTLPAPGGSVTPVPAPVPDPGPALVPAPGDSVTPVLEPAQPPVSAPVKIKQENVGETNKMSKGERKRNIKEELACRNASLQPPKPGPGGHLNPGKSAPYGSDTDDSECSELKPTQICHDSPVVSPRIKAACDFMKRQHAVAQDAEVRYFTSS